MVWKRMGFKERRWSVIRVKLQVSPLRYPGFPVQEIRVRPCPTARSTAGRDRRGRRDDKVKGGGAPWHEWRWMDRVEETNWDRFG
jgi:hypothetical protein